MDNQALIESVFRICDTKNQNFVEKRDFIKLLYNYPDKDVFRLIRETSEFPYVATKTPVEISMVDGPRLDTGRSSYGRQNANKRKSEFNINIDSSMLNEENVMNLTEMVNKKSIDAYQHKGKTLGLTAQPFNIQPTTIDNKTKFIADLIYKRYGKNGRFEYNEFCQWIKMHKDFLNSFKDWFRLDVWTDYFDVASNRHTLSFNRKTPIISGPVRTQKFKTYKKVRAYAKLYDSIFMILANENDSVPYRVVLLKLIEISYNMRKHKIIIDHDCPKYERFKVCLPNAQAFEQWKRVFDNFTNDSIFKKYEWSDSEIIGKGKFSKVYRVRERATAKEYALKLINKTTLLEEERIILINEAGIMQVLSHNNIVKMYQSIETHENYFHVLELVNGDDLYNYVSKRKFLDEYEASWIMKNLFDAIDYVHSTGIVHRDLKPENVMLEFNAKNEITKVKIIDFGLACYSEDENAMRARCGTLNYTAPEILTGEKYDSRVDIFSLGVIMYFMIRGSLPFYSDDQYIVAKKTVEGDYEMDDDDFFMNVSDNCKSIIKGLLQPEPNNRLGLVSAITDDWILKGETLKKYKNKNREQFDLNKFI